MRFPSGVNGKTERVAESGAEAFEKLVAPLDYPMFVVTTEANGIAAGCLVGFASQASIRPVSWLVCPSRTTRSEWPPAPPTSRCTCSIASTPTRPEELEMPASKTQPPEVRHALDWPAARARIADAT